MPKTMYLIIKRGLYYRPESSGYTGLKREAGRYTEEDSAWVEKEGHLDSPRVTRIAEALAPRFSLACPHDVYRNDLERGLDATLDLVRECLKAERARRKKLKDGSVAAGYCDGRLERLEASLADLVEGV